MKSAPRRQFLVQTTVLAAATLMGAARVLAQSTDPVNRKFTLSLAPVSIGVHFKSLSELVDYAHGYGFESVDAWGLELSLMSADEVRDLVEDMRSKHVAWGKAGLPVEFRQSEEKFSTDLKNLPKVAAALQLAGVKRITASIPPFHETLTYEQNSKQHVKRLRVVAKILKDHGLRFGLEYIGTPSLRKGKPFEFVHNLKQVRELIAAINTGNLGVVLDSWHWWLAGETVADIAALKNQDIVSVDINDAPTGIPKEEQIDTQRELPCATGVIEIAPFLKALIQLGYDGPVRAEPFNRRLSEMENEDALALTMQSYRQALDKLEP